MQPHKQRFRKPDGGREGSLQSCVRTDDLELVGDPTHLTYFEMLGNFSFGGPEFEHSVDLWHCVLTDLNVTGVHVRVHPSQEKHRRLWERHGYRVEPDDQCCWSDGEIGGFCCEVFVEDLELGNLVQPLEHSTDVGFGWERLVQVLERQNCVYQSSLFEQSIHPVLSDHQRTLSVLLENGVTPGSRGRSYVCRRLLRRMLKYLNGSETFEFDDLLDHERELRRKSLQHGQRYWRRHKDKPLEFWWETFGILPEEVERLH